MKRLIVLLCVALGACSETSAIEEAVRENLIDPESAQFGEITRYTDDDGTENACVEVNARNRMGGYTGEQLMIAMKGENGAWWAASLGDAAEGYDCAFFIKNIVEKRDK